MSAFFLLIVLTQTLKFLHAYTSEVIHVQIVNQEYKPFLIESILTLLLLTSVLALS